MPPSRRAAVLAVLASPGDAPGRTGDDILMRCRQVLTVDGGPWRIVLDVSGSPFAAAVFCEVADVPGGAMIGDLPFHAWEVEHLARWDDVGTAAVEGGGVGLVRAAFLHRLPSLDHDAFARHWTEVHAPLARRHHPALVRYDQHVVVRALTPDAPEFDAVSELGFRDRRAMEEEMYDSAEGKAIVGSDIAAFLDLKAGMRVLGPEHVLR